MCCPSDCLFCRRSRQIAPQVLASRAPAGAFRFAVLYGTGLLTYLPSTAPHVLAVVAVLLGDTWMIAGIAVGSGWGGHQRSLLKRFVLSGRPHESVSR